MNDESKGLPPDGEHRYSHYRLTGRTPEQFARVREQLWTWIQQLLETQVSPNTGTVREELAGLTEGLLGFAKAKLASPTVENERAHAEAVEHFANAKKAVAEARKTDAVAERIEINNKIKKLKLALMMSKVVIGSDKGEDAIIFGQDIDAMLSCLREMESVQLLPGGGNP